LDPSCIRNQLTFPTDSRFFVWFSHCQ
jgi:hypothetical protein